MASDICFSVCLSLVVHTSVYHEQAGRGERQFSPIFPSLILKPLFSPGVGRVPWAAAAQGRGSLPQFGLQLQDSGPRRWPGPGPPALRSGQSPGSGRPPGSAGAAGTGGSDWVAAPPGWPVPSFFAASLALPAGCLPQLPGYNWAELLEREAGESDRGRLPLGSEGGRGLGAVPGGLGSEVKAAVPWSPSGGPRSNRGWKSQAEQDGRPGRAAPAAGQRRQS